MEIGLCRCEYTRVETTLNTRLSTTVSSSNGWTSGSVGGSCSAGPRVRTARGQTGNLESVPATREQREAPQGKARVERRHEGARPPPRLA